MREIEVKAKLHDKAGFLTAAKQHGIVFGEAITQDDMTFENETPHDDPSWNILRIRKQDGVFLLTMKHRASSRSRDNHEYETAVSDAVAVEKMLGRLGYTPGIRIVKTRRIAHYQDLEVCLDEVADLGTFVEAEKLAADDADVDAIQTELWTLLQELGVGPQDRTHGGYDTLMRASRAA